jgi:uncharacterized protein
MGYIFLESVDKANTNEVKFEVNGITLFITEKCNLGCKYCYEKTIKNKEHMTEEIARKAIDLMVKYSDINNRLYISFFGGEPFLNIKLMKYIIQYCKDINIYGRTSFSVTTNGTIANSDIINFLKSNNINLLVSIDGLEEIQNKNRPFLDGRPTFNNVIKNINIFKSNTSSLIINSVISHDSVDLLNIYKLAREIGIIEYIPSIASSSENNSQLTLKEVEKILFDSEEIIKIFVNDILNNQSTTIPNFIHFAKRLYPQYKNQYYCNMGIKAFAVVASGEVYPCHRYCNDRTYSLGNIGQFVPGNKKHYLQYKKLNCDECWANGLCNGGCMHENSEICSNYGSDLICLIRKRWCELSLASYSIIASKKTNKLLDIIGIDEVENCKKRYLDLSKL